MNSIVTTCPKVSLSNGLQIPILGLGTSHHGGYSHDAMLYALRECGVRHIDTAKRYGCEEQLSIAVQESGVPRQDLWLTTKLWPGEYGYTASKKACRDSCSRLGVEYLGKAHDNMVRVLFTYLIDKKYSVLFEIMDKGNLFRLY
ncbi:unnamed protein product [Oncorhynchus mykiss]|uniref:NADP-dependent oxidoreductase domain-containing protein n=1 Tax=Oncorhynchus mykiss TaxID=8022 RepID=A0A060X4J4_ONCMY|nr:unnamed protein product [Oncorhynchus mykiss]